MFPDLDTAAFLIGAIVMRTGLSAFIPVAFYTADSCQACVLHFESLTRVELLRSEASPWPQLYLTCSTDMKGGA